MISCTIIVNGHRFTGYGVTPQEATAQAIALWQAAAPRHLVIDVTDPEPEPADKTS